MSDAGFQRASAAPPRPAAGPAQSAQWLGAVLGHELRNPLASALTNVAMAAELTEPTDPRAPALARALDDLERVTALLDRYLDLGVRHAVPREMVDLAAFAAAYASARTRVELVGPAARPRALACADALLLERVLDNLVDNAVDGGARRVRLALIEFPDELVLEVTDDGPGVPAPVADHVFQPFVSGREGGTGLGLAIVADVLTALGGRAEHVPVPRGACFRLVLPRV